MSCASKKIVHPEGGEISQKKVQKTEIMAQNGQKQEIVPNSSPLGGEISFPVSV